MRINFSNGQISEAAALVDYDGLSYERAAAVWFKKKCRSLAELDSLSVP